VDGGWLSAEVTDGVNDVEEEDECSERKREIIYVRSKCLTATRTTSLLFHMCHTAALWTDTFTRDEEDVFQEKASEVIASITSKRVFEADGLPNPLLNLQLGMRPCYLQIQ